MRLSERPTHPIRIESPPVCAYPYERGETRRGMTLLDNVGEIERLDTIEEIWSRTVEELGRQGLPHVIYITVDQCGQNPLVLTNVPGVFDAGPPQDDPFLAYACDSYDVMRTGLEYMPSHKELTEAERDFVRLASRTGFRAGLGIPMRLRGSHRYGGFNVGSGLTREEFDRRIWPRAEQFRLFCLLIHRRIEELGGASLRAANNDFRDLLVAPASAGLEVLSPRESEVIYLIAQGISRKEAARLCGISPNTVADYTKSAYRKLGVQNRVEAARLVLARTG